MELNGLSVGFAFTGSFCTIFKVLTEVERIVNEGACVFPILSGCVSSYDTRFGSSLDFKKRVADITGNEPITTISAAEPIGPKMLLDVLVIAPCTGNTLGKIANGITDTPVTMACKAHLRNQRPVVLSISTNDGLGANAKNIGLALNSKNVYFVPFGQDDAVKKPCSLVSKNELIISTIVEALKGKQIQPILI